MVRRLLRPSGGQGGQLDGGRTEEKRREAADNSPTTAAAEYRGEESEGHGEEWVLALTGLPASRLPQ